MRYVHLAADRPGASGLQAFVRDLVIRLGLKGVRERESSNYPSGGYFVSEIDKVRVEISELDEDGFQDHRFLIVCQANDEDWEASELEKHVDAIVRADLLPAGYRVVRVVDFGKKKTMRQIPFL
jgi:hypothetical protein